MPLRVAVVQGGISEKTIATKAYQTTVNDDRRSGAPFTLVADGSRLSGAVGAVGDYQSSISASIRRR